jgi:hypothetical protein
VNDRLFKPHVRSAFIPDPRAPRERGGAPCPAPADFGGRPGLFRPARLPRPSVSEIATAAGVSNANIYQYFENKEALIIALIEEEVRHDLTLVHKLSGSKLRARTSARS